MNRIDGLLCFVTRGMMRWQTPDSKGFEPVVISALFRSVGTFLSRMAATTGD
jgi:hypothetical protein